MMPLQTDEKIGGVGKAFLNFIKMETHFLIKIRKS